MIHEITAALAQSWHNLANAFVQFVPRLIAAAIIFAAGFVVAVVARWIVRVVLAALHFDRLAARTGASEMLRVAEMPTADILVAKIIFWIVWMGFIVSAVDTLQFAPFQGTGPAVLLRSCPGSCWRCWCSPWDSWWATSSGAPRCWRRSTRGCRPRVCSAARCGSW